jgi:release factor glutamine methyltransferase
MAFNLQTIKDIRNYITGELKDIYPEKEVQSIFEIVISYTLGINRISILRDPGMKVSEEQIENITAICRELKEGKPVQYITGETTFYNCIINVNPSVLIPRPETEELADLVIKENRGFTGNIIDIGTGSGCIAVALAANIPGASVSATDISVKALETAEKNAVRNNVKINFVHADIFDPEMAKAFNADIIVSNPPYVMESEKMQMHTNVLDYEPHEALFVPDYDQLVFYRAIFDQSRIILNEGGRIYLEINEKSGFQLQKMMESYNYKEISLVRDINGKDRIIKGVKNG